MIGILRIIFGCRHPRTTFPFTDPVEKKTTVKCLDCGAQFDYSWKEMKIGARV